MCELHPNIPNPTGKSSVGTSRLHTRLRRRNECQILAAEFAPATYVSVAKLNERNRASRSLGDLWGSLPDSLHHSHFPVADLALARADWPSHDVPADLALEFLGWRRELFAFDTDGCARRARGQLVCCAAAGMRPIASSAPATAISD